MRTLAVVIGGLSAIVLCAQAQQPVVDPSKVQNPAQQKGRLTFTPTAPA